MSLQSSPAVFLHVVSSDARLPRRGSPGLWGPSFWMFQPRHHCLCKFHRHCHSVASLLSSSRSGVFIVSAAALLGRKGSFL